MRAPAPLPSAFNFTEHLIARNAGRAERVAYIDDRTQLTYGALADAIHRLLANPFEAQRLAKSAQARAASEYGIGRMVERYVALYQGLLTNGTRP